MLVTNLCAQGKSAYILYNSSGKKTSFKKLSDDAKKSDCILFGEYHDNPIVHWLQLELTNELASTNLILGFEMFDFNSKRKNLKNTYT
jgi:uncharacterized iron-regulated protein